MSLRIGFLLLGMFSASARIVTAAACTQSSSIPVPAFPLGGGCTLSSGRTVSNFRAVGTATGGATLPASVAGLEDSAAMYRRAPRLVSRRRGAAR